MTPRNAEPTASPARNQVVLLWAYAASMVLSLGLTVLLGRTLTATQFGFVGMVATVFSLAHEFTDLGTGNVAVRLTARAPASAQAILGALLGLRLLLGLIAGACSVALALAQDSWIKTAILLAAAPILALSCVSAFSVVFQWRQWQLGPAVVGVGAQAACVAVAVAMLAFRVPGEWLALPLLLREASVVLSIPLLARRLLGVLPRPRLGFDGLQIFLGRAAIVALATLLYHVQFQGGPFLVQALRPEAELGAFAAAFRPLAPVLFVPWLIVLPLVPVLSWLAQGNEAAFRRQSQGALDLSVGIGAVVFAGAGPLAGAALDVLYGGRFSAGPLSAVATLQWFVLPLGCSFPAAAISTVLLAKQQEAALLLISLIGAAAYLAFNLVLLPRFGFVGAAMATAFSIGAVTLAGSVQLARGFGGIRPRWRTLAILLPACLLSPVMVTLSGSPAVLLALGASLSGAALLAVWFFPGLPCYRSEQDRLSQQALAHF